MAQVQVVTAATGWPATVVVDGVDVSRQVRRVVLDAAGGQVPRVVLEAVGGFSFEGSALIESVPAEPRSDMDWMAGARAWLEHVDWQRIGVLAAQGSMASPIHEVFRDALLADLDQLRTGERSRG